MHSKTKNIVLAALIAALACVATMIIKIPSPMKGYLNLGDCVVLAAGWLLPGGYGFFAAGLGSALADLFSGYVIYAPATFVIKGVMALIAFVCLKLKMCSMHLCRGMQEYWTDSFPCLMHLWSLRGRNGPSEKH